MLSTVKTYSLNEYNFTVIDGNLKIIKKPTPSNTLATPSNTLVATHSNTPATPSNALATPSNTPATPVKAPKKRDNENLISVMYCIKRCHSDPTNYTINKKTKTNNDNKYLTPPRNNPSNKRDDINNKVSLPFPIFDSPIFDFKTNSDIINTNSNIINTNSNIINAPLRRFNSCTSCIY